MPPEAEILTGTNDRVKAAHMLHEWGARSVMISHNTELLVYDGEKISPARSRRAICPAARPLATPPSQATSTSVSTPRSRKRCSGRPLWSPSRWRPGSLPRLPRGRCCLHQRVL
ncbi:MAG: hypothetical protein ACLR4Z_04075 [Butyricicoccaceae bacterium]